MLVVRAIHVTYHLVCSPDQHERAERAHEIHADYCPVARTIRDCVRISTELVFDAAT